MNQLLRVAPLPLASCLATWVGVSALLIPSALAQVNGPGPSPASTFDTVLNLPGDEALIVDPPGLSTHPEIGGNIQLNVGDGGNLLPNVTVNRGVEVNVSGGTVGDLFTAEIGSEVNVSGGTVGGGFTAQRGSVVDISGGTFGNYFRAMDRSVVTISGGTFGGLFEANYDSDIELRGGEFRLNGVPQPADTISTRSLERDDIFTGTLADGSTFIFGTSSDVFFTDLTLTEVTLPPADLNPIFVNTLIDSGPSGLRPGQTMTIGAGGSIARRNFAVIAATLNIVDGGILGSAAEVTDSLVNISGGTVGNSLFARDDTVVNISGGTLDGLIAGSGSEVNISGESNVNHFSARDGSVVNITDGTFGDYFGAAPGSEVNISGGTFGNNFLAGILSGVGSPIVNISGGTFGDNFTTGNYRGHGNPTVDIGGGTFGDGFTVGHIVEYGHPVANISGGTFGENFRVLRDGALNLFGSQFSIDGVPLDSLRPGQALTITDRDVTLSGVLDDGQPFSFDLNSVEFLSNDFFSSDATVTVTLGPPILLGDCNLDGVVNFLDIFPFLENLSSNAFNNQIPQADCNQDGIANFLDIAPLIAILTVN